MSNVDNAVEVLDRLAQDEAGRKALGEVAERLSRLFGGHAFAQQKAIPTRPTEVVAVEQTEFDVLLVETGPTKINVIKATREVTGLGLKEAKDFVEKTSERCLKSGVDRATAELLRSKMEAAGAKVVLR